MPFTRIKQSNRPFRYPRIVFHCPGGEIRLTQGNRFLLVAFRPDGGLSREVADYYSPEGQPITVKRVYDESLLPLLGGLLFYPPIAKRMPELILDPAMLANGDLRVIGRKTY